MDEHLEKAMQAVLAMIRPNIKSDDAIKFSQAALNLAQVRALEKQKKQ